MNHLKEIVAVGSIAFDSITTCKGSRQKILGGSSTYFGVAASLFTKVNLIGVVGEDFSDKEWSLFEKYKIDISSVKVEKGETFSWGGIYSDDFSSRETQFTNLGVFETFKPKIDKQYNDSILYLGNIQPQLQFDVINQIKNPSIVAADSMNLWIDLFPEKVKDLISHVDIFMLNDEEAIQLSGSNDLEKIAKEFLSHGPKIVIIKMGSKGSLVAQKNSINYVSVVQGVDVFDPTGAGDSFAGGLLGYVSINGLSDVNKAVAYGSAVASYTVAGFGLESLEKINFEDLKLKADSIDIK